MLWLLSRTVPPSAASPRTSRCTSRAPVGSSPTVGSSSSSRRGERSSAAASPSRCRIPEENPPTLRSARSPRRTALEHVVDPVPADAVEVGQQLEVPPRGEERVEAGFLDEPRHAVAARPPRRRPDRRPAGRPSPRRARRGRTAPAGTWSCRRRSDRPGRGRVPASTRMSKPSSARTSPKRLTRPRASMAGGFQACIDAPGEPAVYRSHRGLPGAGPAASHRRHLRRPADVLHVVGRRLRGDRPGLHQGQRIGREQLRSGGAGSRRRARSCGSSGRGRSGSRGRSCPR